MIDMNKKYTYHGYPARVICVDANDEYPVIALVEIEGREGICTFTSDGKEDDESPVLIEVKPSRWINIYPTSGQFTREDADRTAHWSRIACIEYKEGEGI